MSGPDLDTPLSIGAGFRVPCLIISPWTCGQGICSDQYDHTSVLRFLNDVTGVPCPNIGKWRLATFGSLSSASPTGFSGTGTAASDVPPRPDAAALRQNAINRYNLAQGNVGSWTQTAAGQLVPDPQSWPPVIAACQVNVTIPPVGQDQVSTQPGASFPNALMVVVNGFEPAELTTPYASSGLQTIPARSPANPACSTRVPDITVTDHDGNPVAIEASCQYVDLDPGSPANQTQTGVPRPFTFTYSLTFTDPDATFGGLPAGQTMLSVNAAFQVDITVTAKAELELTVVSAAQQCAELAASINQRFDRGGPPVTPAEAATLRAQLTACRDQRALTLQQYEQALRQLQELNLKRQPPGPPGGGLPPPP